MLTPQHLQAIAVAERFADGVGSSYELVLARKAARFTEGALLTPQQSAAGEAAGFTCVEDARNAAELALLSAGKAQGNGKRWPPPPPPGASHLVRDLFKRRLRP